MSRPAVGGWCLESFAVFMPRHRHWILRLLIALMGLAALAPGISRAASAWVAHQQPWQVVCHAGSPEGTRTSHVPAGLASLDGNCGFCLLRGDLAPPPEVGTQLPLPSQLRHAQPRLFLDAPATLFAWRPAQARAPPRVA